MLQHLWICIIKTNLLWQIDNDLSCWIGWFVYTGSSYNTTFDYEKKLCYRNLSGIFGSHKSSLTPVLLNAILFWNLQFVKFVFVKFMLSKGVSVYLCDTKVTWNKLIIFLNDIASKSACRIIIPVTIPHNGFSVWDFFYAQWCKKKIIIWLCQIEILIWMILIWHF